MDWRQDVMSALNDFRIVSALAGDRLTVEDLQIQFIDAPHRQSQDLPNDRMAIFGFWLDGSWLKIGKAGPRSQARYKYQHYGFNAPSTLARSVRNDPRMRQVSGLRDSNGPEWGDWIRRVTNRVNILIPFERGDRLLSLLQAYLHVRLHPKYETGPRTRSRGHQRVGP